MVARPQDPLLNRAHEKLQPRTKQTEGTPARDALLTTVLPALSFGITLWAVYGLYAYHPVWLVLYLLASGALLAAGLRASAPGTAGRAGVRLTTLALVAGVLFGLWLYYEHWVYYIRYRDLARNTNVQGSQPAAAFADSGLLTFSSDTQVDVTRSVGFQSALAGARLCVAPVMDGTMAPTDQISFFAVGVDCCGWRAQFACGAAGDAAAKSALLVLEPLMLVSPPMAWAVDNVALREGYAEALRLQHATYGVPVANQTRLLHWVKDAVAVRAEIWWTGARIGATAAGVLFFVLCFLAGAFSASWALLLDSLRWVAGHRREGGPSAPVHLSFEQIKQMRKMAAGFV